MDGEGRIEIELISHDPRPSGRGRPRPAPDGGPPPDAEPEEPDTPEPVAGRSPERIRLVTTAGVVGVLALLLGWMVGRSGGAEGDDVTLDGGPTVPTTVPLPFETLPIDGEAIAPGEFEEPIPTTQVVRRTTTVSTTSTVPIGPTTQQVPIDGRLLGIPIRLVGVELGGTLVELDLATGTLTDFNVRRVVSDGSGITVGPDWVLAGGDNPARVVWSDGTESTVDIGDAWRPLHVPGTDLFWRTPVMFDSADGYALDLVDIHGERVGPEIVLPLNTWPYAVDPASNGVVVANVSRSFAVTADGPEYLGIGELIGISDDEIVFYDCDEQFRCSLYRTDRATGAITIVPPDPTLTEDYRWQSTIGWGGTTTESMISPDGRWLAVVGNSFRSSTAGIIDLETGRFVELGRDSYPPAIVFSPDTRYAFAVGSQRVVAYDIATDERFAVFGDTTQWLTLGMRPVVPSTEPDAPTTVTTSSPLVGGSAPAEEPVEG